MSQLVLHIGDPKTGTTSIQRALNEGLVDCGDRRVLPWRTANPTFMANCLLSGDETQIAAHYTEMRDWLVGREDDLKVLSSEAFGSVPPRKLRQVLSQHLPKYSESARVIAYVRPHSSRFLAAFIQRTKTGHLDRPLGEFLERMGKEEGTLRYSKRFLEWRRVFGDSFSLRPFVRSELCNQDVVTDFYRELLGDESFSVSRPVEENVSVTTRALSGILLMHRRLLQTGGRMGEQRAVGAYVANHLLLTGPVKGAKPKLDRENAEKLLTAYRKDAQRLDQEFFLRPIMEESLESSLEDAADEAVDLDPTIHFTPSEKMALERLAEEAARTFLKHPRICIQHFRHVRGLLSPNLSRRTKLSVAVRKLLHRRMLRQLDAQLMEFADILRH